MIEGRFPKTGQQALDLFFQTSDIEIVPVDRQTAELARLAFRTFGKGGHKAGLNFGDCIAYATAKLRNAPLLAKGEDFNMTDVTLAF
jgi:ribonuclease VapC